MEREAGQARSLFRSQKMLQVGRDPLASRPIPHLYTGVCASLVSPAMSDSHMPDPLIPARLSRSHQYTAPRPPLVPAARALRLSSGRPPTLTQGAALAVASQPVRPLRVPARLFAESPHVPTPSCAVCGPRSSRRPSRGGRGPPVRHQALQGAER